MRNEWKKEEPFWEFNNIKVIIKEYLNNLE